MKKILLFITMITFGSILFAQETPDKNLSSANSNVNNSSGVMTITLKEAIEIAKKNNKDIQLSRYDLRKADAQIGEARSGAFPQISLSAQYSRIINPAVMIVPPGSPFSLLFSKFMSDDSLEQQRIASRPLEMSFSLSNNFNTGITAQQVLFSPKLNTAIKIAKDYSKYSEHTNNSVEVDVVLQVKKAFYSALLAREVVEVNKQGLDLAKANYDNLSSLFKQGMASEFDVLRAEVQVSNTEPGLIQAENNFVLAKNGLKNLLGMSINDAIELKGQLVLNELPKEVIDKESPNILVNNENLKSLKLLEDIYEKNISIEKADYYPSVAAFANYSYQSQDNTFKLRDYNWTKNFVVGLQFSVPIFNGLQTNYKTEQARIDKDKITIQREKLEDGLTIQLENAVLRMNESKKRIDAQLKSVEQAAKAVSIAEVRFKNGVGTQLELIDAQVALSRTQINKLQAIYDYLNARADWEQLTGYEEE